MMRWLSEVFFKSDVSAQPRRGVVTQFCLADKTRFFGL